MSKDNFICGDCTNKIQQIEDNSVDLIISDPFFEEAENLMDQLNQEYYRVLKQNGILIVFSKTPHNAITQVETQKVFDFENEYIWHYTDTSTFRSKNMPLIEHENIMIFHKGDKSKIDMESIRQEIRRPEENKQYKGDKCRGKEGKEVYWQPNSDGNWRSSVLKIQRTLKGPLLNKESLPTGVKPVDLISILVEGYSEKGDVVLDPFLGTGTTSVVCKQLGRVCIGIEKNSRYLDMAVERYMEEWQCDKINNGNSKSFGKLEKSLEHFKNKTDVREKNGDQYE